MKKQARFKVIKRGQIIDKDGQRFECTEIVPYENKRGKVHPIAVMVSECLDCKRQIRVRHKIRYEVFQPSRRCDLHKAPGMRVTTKLVHWG